MWPDIHADADADAAGRPLPLADAGPLLHAGALHAPLNLDKELPLEL